MTRTPRRPASLPGSTVSQVRTELGGAPRLASSSRWEWAGPLQADEFGAYLANGMTALPRDHIVITTTRESSGYVRQSRGGKTLEGPSLTGESIIIPSGEPTRWDGTLPGHLRMALSPSLVAEAAADVFGARASRVSVGHVMRSADPVLARLADLMTAELRTPDHPAQRLLVDSLATAVAAHLLRGYAGLDEPRFIPPALAPAGVRRALEYIHQDPAATPALAELAAVAGLSRHHFARAFRDATGESPVRYVERIRIDQAIRLLRNGSMSLAEIAAATGYSDQSHFTRRFRARTGVTPGRYRSRKTFTVLRGAITVNPEHERSIAVPHRRPTLGSAGATADGDSGAVRTGHHARRQEPTTQSPRGR